MIWLGTAFGEASVGETSELSETWKIIYDCEVILSRDQRKEYYPEIKSTKT